MASQSADTGGDGNQVHPYVPLSHPFVERLIGTIRREYLDHMLFWTTVSMAATLSRTISNTSSCLNSKRLALAALSGQPRQNFQDIIQCFPIAEHFADPIVLLPPGALRK